MKKVNELKGYENVKEFYYVTTCGKVYNTKNSNFLKPHGGTTGYSTVKATTTDRNEKGHVKTRHLRIHRLVALAFIPNDNIKKYQVNNIDMDRSNASVCNLEWVNNRENKIKAMVETNDIRKGLTRDNILFIRKHYIISDSHLCNNNSPNRWLWEKFGVERRTVNKIGKGITYKHIV